MGDFFKRLDEIMTGDLVRKAGGAVCVIALILVGAGFLCGAKSVLSTMKASSTAVVATEDEDAENDEGISGEEEDEDAENDEGISEEEEDEDDDEEDE